MMSVMLDPAQVIEFPPVLINSPLNASASQSETKGLLASVSNTPCSSRSVVCASAVTPAEDIAKMGEMFSNMSDKQLKYLYDLSNHSFSCAVDCALEGPSMESLRILACTKLTIYSIGGESKN